MFDVNCLYGGAISLKPHLIRHGSRAEARSYKWCIYSPWWMERTNTFESINLSKAVDILQHFSGADLTRTLARIEASLRGITIDACPTALAACHVESDVLAAAALVKR